MFNSKKGNIILSLIVAIAVWAYVVGEVDPVVTEEFTNVPISLVNEKVIQEEGLAVLSVSDDTMTVKLTGKRSVISKIKANDISATVDISEAVKGDNDLKIDIKVPEKTELDDKSINKVTVSIDDSISRTKDVKVKYNGKFSENTEPTTKNVSVEKVTVTGAKTKVDQIKYVEAKIGSDKVLNKETEVTCTLNPVDRNGKSVENVKLSTSTVSVSTILMHLKTVALDVQIVDNTAEGDVKKETSAPDTIVVKGSEDVLKNIEDIKTETVNITDINQYTEINLVPILPDGVVVSEKNDNIILTVTVEEITSKDFTFEGSDVELNGIVDGLKAEAITNKIVVTITGTKSQLDDIEASDIKLSADASKFDSAGDTEHEIALSCSCDKSYKNLSVNTSKIKIKLEEL